MRDLKAPKPNKIKANKRKRQKAERDWKKILSRLLRISVFTGSASLLVVGTVLAVRLLFASDFFQVRQVRVENNQRVSGDEIVALSDILAGTNIFDLDLALIGRKIEEDPWIASAEVQRVFPGDVVIRVTERKAKLVVSLDYLYYVDASGEVFKALEAGDDLDYPVVTGLERSFFLDQPDQARAALCDALQLADELARRSKFNLDDVSEFSIDREEGLIIYTSLGGVPVKIGRQDFAAKLDRLERIYWEIEPRLAGLKYIDLNVMDRVIVKLDTLCVRGKG